MRNHLSEGMRLEDLRHIEMAEELVVLQVAVSSVVESALGHSPNEILHVEVVGEFVAGFRKLEDWRSRLQQPATMIYNLLLAPPHSWGRLANRLDGPSSLLVPMSMVVELFEGQINCAATNGVHWGSCSVLVAALSHFSELKSKLELLSFRRNTDLSLSSSNATHT
jgi:hypothetical protein